MNSHYIYVIVRRDIPLADQIVQVGHACFEGGLTFSFLGDSCNLVLAEAQNQEELCRIQAKINSLGIKNVIFWEEDESMGYTAICTEPIEDKNRGKLRGLAMWRP